MSQKKHILLLTTGGSIASMPGGDGLQPSDSGVFQREMDQLQAKLDPEVSFITSQELEDRFPDKSAKEREYEAAREYGAVFIQGIGAPLKSGKPHDGRAPDYDDWSLNGDIIVYYPVLDIALELSSMGIRVDEEAMRRQLKASGCTDREELPFHKALLNGELPYTIGGGIGQSRMCMFFLRKAHIGEVQSSFWTADEVKACEAGGVTADMSASEINAILVEQFTSMTFDGLTGAGMTWAATGEVSKAPMAVVIENGTYVSAEYFILNGGWTGVSPCPASVPLKRDSP